MVQGYWAIVVGLGVASFDPVGAVSFVAAVSLGASRGRLLVRSAASVGTSLVLSLAAVLGLGPTIHRLLRHLELTGRQQPWLILAVGVACLAWACGDAATRRRPPSPPGPHARCPRRVWRPPATRTWGLIAAGPIAVAAAAIRLLGPAR